VVTPQCCNSKLVRADKYSIPDNWVRLKQYFKLKDSNDIPSKPSRLVTGHPDTSNCFMLLKPLRGCKEDNPQFCKDSFSMLAQPPMPARLKRSGAFVKDSSTTRGAIPSKLTNPSWSEDVRTSCSRLLSSAKPWSDVVAQVDAPRCNTSSCCNVLRGCRLLKLKGAWTFAE
jgi:hypothetical protein